MEAAPKVPSRPNVYQYDDFRAYLKAAYEFLKAADPAYSYRKFARDAAVSNPGYLLDELLTGNGGLEEAAEISVQRPNLQIISDIRILSV